MIIVKDNALPKAGDDAATAKFYDLDKMMKLKDKFAFDHYEILELVYNKVNKKWFYKLRYYKKIY